MGISEEAGFHVHDSGSVLEAKVVAYSFVPYVYLRSTGITATVELYYIY